MGNTQQKEPPKVVLVIPLFERDHKGRSRMAKSTYDTNFCKPKLKWLFNDYMLPGGRLWLLLSPPEDSRVSVSARLGSGGQGLREWGSSNAGGSLALRFQPQAEEPLTFVDVRAGSSQGAGNAARLRACFFDTATGLGAFATTDLLARSSASTAPNSTSSGSGLGGGLRHSPAVQLGVRYSSPWLSAGAVARPGLGGVLDAAWVVSRAGPMTFGVQVAPAGGAFGGGGGGMGCVWGGGAGGSGGGGKNGAVNLLDELSAAERRGGLAGAWDELQRHTSYAIAYTPATAATVYGRGTFCAALEVAQQRQLLVSFLHHNALQRQVRNPFERKDVVAITNYLDLGLQMALDLQPQTAAAEAAAGSGGSTGGAAAATEVPPSATFRLAAAWQVNKNLLLKARVGMDSMAASLALKSWWAPSLTLAAAAGWDIQRARPTAGLAVHVENYGNIRYERPPPGMKMVGKRLVQRHEASQEDIATAEGKGVEVPLEAQADPALLGQVGTKSATYL